MKDCPALYTCRQQGGQHPPSTLCKAGSRPAQGPWESELPKQIPEAAVYTLQKQCALWLPSHWLGPGLGLWMGPGDKE